MVENRVKSRCCCYHKVGAALYRQLKAKRRSYLSVFYTCFLDIFSAYLLHFSLTSFAYRNKFFCRRDATDASLYRVPAADTAVDSMECPLLIQLSFIYFTGLFD